MSAKKNNQLSGCLPKDTLLKNKSTFTILESYSHVSDIIERTHKAMGKKASYKSSNSNTISEKLNLNVFCSTH